MLLRLKNKSTNKFFIYEKLLTWISFENSFLSGVLMCGHPLRV